MTKEELHGIFLLAGITILREWELPNRYWPEAYAEERKNSPWWLVKIDCGLIEIGWRKRVISIDWEDTGARCLVTDDDVTKSETMVHAWSNDKAVKYLSRLKTQLTTA